jgi:hypothetical protein
MSLWKMLPIAWVVSASASGLRAGGIFAAWSGDEVEVFITRSCQDPDGFPETEAFSTLRGGGFPMLDGGTLALMEDVSTSPFERGLLWPEFTVFEPMEKISTACRTRRKRLKVHRISERSDKMVYIENKERILI